MTGTSEEFYTTGAVARLTGLSRSTVARLVDSGRIPSVRVGAHRRIPKSFLAQTAQSSLAQPLDSRQIVALAPGIREIAASHGADNVRLFGSFARNEARADSDVDLMVDLEPDRSLFDLVALTDELESLLGRRVDVGTERSLRREARKTAAAEAIPI